MRETVNVLGVEIDKITAEYALRKALRYVRSPGVSVIYTPNPEIIMAAYENDEFKSVLNSADMCTPDGIGVVFASKMLRSPVPERVAGFDLACGLLECISKTGESVFLFGAKPGVAALAAKKLEEKYPGLKIAGTHDGYFKDEDEENILKQINDSGASLLFVCLGAPKQENWIYKNRDKLKVNLCMGVGGTLDVFAGNVKRAPEIFIKCNLEWFYRMCKQPSRLGRFAVLPKFIKAVRKSRGVN